MQPAPALQMLEAGDGELEGVVGVRVAAMVVLLPLTPPILLVLAHAILPRVAGTCAAEPTSSPRPRSTMTPHRQSKALGARDAVPEAIAADPLPSSYQASVRAVYTRPLSPFIRRLPFSR